LKKRAASIRRGLGEELFILLLLFIDTIPVNERSENSSKEKGREFHLGLVIRMESIYSRMDVCSMNE